MGRPKGSKNKAAKKNSDPSVEDTYETTVEYMCPKRGLVKQKVKVKKLKPMSPDAPRQIMGEEDELEKLDKQELTPLDEETD